MGGIPSRAGTRSRGPLNFPPGMARFLMIHGVYHGPECWDPVVRLLERAGHECRALALRGHTLNDRGTHNFSGEGYRDYLEDVRHALEIDGDDVIVVGHSLGGMLAQSILYERRVRGAVLMAVPTPRSLSGGVLKLLRRFPVATMRFLLTLRSEVMYHNPHVVPWLFWSRSADDLPEPRWLQDVLSFREPRRLFWDVLWLRFPSLDHHTPVQVLAGDRDFALPPASLDALARQYAGTFRLVPGAPHDLMLTHADEVAQLLSTFAESTDGT